MVPSKWGYVSAALLFMLLRSVANSVLLRLTSAMTPTLRRSKVDAVP